MLNLEKKIMIPLVQPPHFKDEEMKFHVGKGVAKNQVVITARTWMISIFVSEVLLSYTTPACQNKPIQKIFQCKSLCQWKPEFGIISACHIGLSTTSVVCSK